MDKKLKMQIEYWDIDRLIPYARNPRKNDEAAQKLAGLIREFGFKVPIVARSNGDIIDGHARLKAARILGMDEVPVVLADEWTPAQVKAFRLAVNRSAEWAEWDDDLLELELDDLKLEEFDLSLIGFEDVTLDAGTEGLTDPDDVPDVHEQPVTRDGDIWLLGKHRLMCGDSTDAGSVALLMDGQKADMVFTDPPYNVAIGSKNAFLNSVQPSGRCCEDFAGDKGETDEEIGERLWYPAFKNMLDNAKDSCSIYVTMPQGGTHMMMMMMMQKACWQIKHELMWLKNSPTFSLGRLDYDYKHEPMLYGWNKSHVFYGKGGQKLSVWEFDKPRKCDLHPTMKPVELIENALLNSSAEGDTILDLFGGSGSTLIACEQTGRQCRMMELAPHYVDVIIRRWQDFTGQEATLAGDGRSFAQIAEERGG